MWDFIQAIALPFLALTAIYLIKRRASLTQRPRCWWAEGTRVILVQGTSRGLTITGTAPIQLLTRGQQIMSFNSRSGQYEVGFVTSLWSMTPKRLTLYEIWVGAGKVAVSSGTAFWSNNCWHKVAITTNEQPPPVSRVTSRPWSDNVYAVVVEPTHNFVAKVGDAQLTFLDTCSS